MKCNSTLIGTGDDCIFYKCTSDFQCLTNKYIDGLCPFEFCNNVYSYSFIFGKYSYTHCGKVTEII
ncbi:hypothetical protein BCR32DRAFT_280694 [Anaeromyces robustus]|uniref:Uncharacterized protein n=1 Tax=Anaeromyces robustus TaxID=1754192 RepID=A0A1Y1X3L7_9FUNG|nr:hypothetical protein BCR32DRAFT_280694 [Anaeromyces robustus]|eukprot:ORX80228.1 hypothetical protein BCR32DRAFT_280694 [Anaeromyces robustus]